MTSTPRIYLPHQECEQTLKISCHALGISHYALAKMLGQRPEHYSKWFNGSRRPSSKYFGRICVIFSLEKNGLPLALVDHFDWDRNEVVYKKGTELGNAYGRDSLSRFGWGIQKAEGQAGSDHADSREES